tara:strand:- start:4155 stop:4919 length:765 start_codon:yes stop_codon:yes gene_type:complete
MAITSFTSIEQLNSVLKVVKLLSTEESFNENWSKVNTDSYENILKNMEKKIRKSKKTPKKAYTAFTSDPEVQKKVTDGKKLSIGEKSKAMSQLWKSMTQEQQQKYQSIADQFNIDNNIVSSEPKKIKLKNKYNIFLADKKFRENLAKTEGSKLGPLELHKLVISKFKTLTKEQLDKYQDEADKFNKENNLIKSNDSQSSVVSLDKQNDISQKEDTKQEQEDTKQEQEDTKQEEEEEMSPKLSQMKKKKKRTNKK